MIHKETSCSVKILPILFQGRLNTLRALKRCHEDSLQALELIGKNLDEEEFLNMKENFKEAIESIDKDINELMA